MLGKVISMKRFAIEKAEYEQIVIAEKQTQDKQISRRLRILMLRYDGLSNSEIAEKVGLCSVRVSQIVSEYKKNGLSAFVQKKYGGNHRNMSESEEREILKEFEEDAAKGTVVIAREIKRAFDGKLGRDTGRGYIYMLLKRHNWRKVMPRSKHPKKANKEAIEASKKLKG